MMKDSRDERQKELGLEKKTPRGDPINTHRSPQGCQGMVPDPAQGQDKQ